MRISIMSVASDDAATIDKVFAVAMPAKATLGHVMRGMFAEAAAKGHLLVARVDGAVVGFASYGVAHQRVRLGYLCVDVSHRRAGVAAALVQTISERHPYLLGISVRCRADYEISEMWRSLGFRKRGEMPGRGKAGQVLIGWWLDHKHPDLFSHFVDPPLLRAAVDANVIRDLDPNVNRVDADTSRALVHDQFRDQINLVVTSSVRREVASIADPGLRAVFAEVMDTFDAVATDQDAVDQAEQRLLGLVKPEHMPYPHRQRDENDLLHVASAVEAGVGVFVTRDERLVEVLREPALKLGLRILKPADVIIHLDELLHADAYRPADLMGTGFSSAKLPSGQDAALRPLAATAGGENPWQFIRMVHSQSASGAERHAIWAPDGSLVGLYIYEVNKGSLDVTVLRVAARPLADTIGRQILLILRQVCRDRGLTAIRIKDSHCGPGLRLAMLDDGFQQVGDEWIAFVIAACGTSADVEGLIVAAARRIGLPEHAPLRSTMPAAVAAHLERNWWPVKIIDSELPSFVVPIRQDYASLLFGVPTPLWRNDTLGLSREHVYYRSARDQACRAPARILWYMSEDRSAPPAIIGCSQLVMTAIGTPEELHDRYQHLGVWNLEQIRAGKNKQRQALRFTGTELFPYPIGLQRLKVMSGDRQGYLTPQSPRRISSDLFAQLYREGQRNE